MPADSVVKPHPTLLRDVAGKAGYIAPPVVPPAPPLAQSRGMLASLVVMVVVPLLVVAGYLWVVAQDQYASRAGFTIRQDDSASASDLLGGMSQLLGGGGAGHADLLFEYLRSQELVLRLDDQLDLRAHYSAHWPRDPVFALPSEGSTDQLVRFWHRVLRVSFDRNTGLLLVEARANTPDYARDLVSALVAESERMINQLNAQSRRDRMQLAEGDLALAIDRLRRAREDLAAFRARTRILDPDADIQGRMGVLNNLQGQLAQHLIEQDLLAQTTAASDPRLRQSERRVAVIRARIREERAALSREDAGQGDGDYPRLIAQYEALVVEQEIAQRGYGAAQQALDLARANAERQSLYIAQFIPPTLTQDAAYPERMLLTGLTGLFALMLWAFGVLGYLSLRDRT